MKKTKRLTLDLNTIRTLTVAGLTAPIGGADSGAVHCPVPECPTDSVTTLVTR